MNLWPHVFNVVSNKDLLFHEFSAAVKDMLIIWKWTVNGKLKILIYLDDAYC